MDIHNELRNIADQEILDKIPEKKICIINTFWEDEYFHDKDYKQSVISEVLSKHENVRYNLISMRNLINEYYYAIPETDSDNLDESLTNTLKNKYKVDVSELFKLYFEILSKNVYPESLGEFPVCTPLPINVFWEREDLTDKNKKAQAIIKVFEHFNMYYEDGIEPYDFYEAYNYAN